MKRRRAIQKVERGNEFEDKSFKMVFDPQDGAIRTQSEVAAICNVSKKAIWEVEKSFKDKIKRKVLADPVLKKIAMEMGLNVIAR